MQQELNTYQAADLLRADTNASWSYEGSLALARYLEDLEEGTGEPINFNVVDIRCEYTEYKSLEDWANNYGTSDTIDLIGEDDLLREYIQERGQLIEFNGGIIASEF
tara:strand:- start:161 stop:481 length:321 start_codon:yes stop_codon:yes gene_type:complete